MKNKTTLSIALAISVALLSLIGTAPVNAQGGGSMESVASIGLIILNPDEVLEVTVVKKGGTVQGNVIINNATFRYQPACSEDGACSHIKVFESESSLRILNDEAISWEIRPTPGVGPQGVSVSIDSNRPNRIAVAGMIFKLVPIPGTELKKKEYIGHVTLMK